MSGEVPSSKFQVPNWERLRVISGHVIEALKQIAEKSVQCVVTSPPYWGLRSYLPKGHPLKHLEIGQEATPDWHNGFNDKWDALTPEEQAICGRNKRDVWTIAPANYPEAHFATFPKELIKPCILAGTSSYGACMQCGAPLRRILDRKLIQSAKACRNNVVDARDAMADPQDQGSNRQKDGHVPGMVRADRTVGWERTCECEDGAARQHSPTMPCIVLDPFGGSGTTGEVALELGRRAILIELNPDYLPLIERRTNAVTPGLPL